MNKRIYLVTTILALLLLSTFAAVPASSMVVNEGGSHRGANTTAVKPEGKPSAPVVVDPRPIDVGPIVRKTFYPIDASDITAYSRMSAEVVGPMSKTVAARRAQFQSLKTTSSSSYYEVGDVVYWLIYDGYYGRLRWRPFRLKAIGEHVEVWLQLDRRWPYGDPRPYQYVSDAQIEYLVDEFDNHIYPIAVEFFGGPQPHNGSDAVIDDIFGLSPDAYFDPSGRNVLLVENIRDENYYDPTYPFYIIGVYIPSLEYYFDRNIITIDSYQWWRRLGPMAGSCSPDIAGCGTSVGPRPYVIDDTVIHEYQHLIHDDYNPDDPSFMNEGLSMFAALYAGYPFPDFDMNSYLTTPDNSLTEWEDQGGLNVLCDYGQAALWATYLADHYGPEFLQSFLKSGIPGIEGIDATLAGMGYTATFKDVYHDFTLANLLHSDTPGEGKYNYETFDLGDPMFVPIHKYTIDGLPVPETTGTSFGNSITYAYEYDTGIAKLPAYGVDYIDLTGWTSTGRINFKGDAEAVVGWQIVQVDGDHEWWSDIGNMKEYELKHSFTLPSATSISLTFDTSYEIEEDWDFGFVEVSTDGGNTWDALPLYVGGEKITVTTSPYSGYGYPWTYAEDREHITGIGSYTAVTADLTPYAGRAIQLRFFYLTDPAYQMTGWYVDNIAIAAANFSDDVEHGLGQWQVEYPPLDWSVTIVIFKADGTVEIQEMPITNKQGTSTVTVAAPSYVTLVIRNTPEGAGGLGDYTIRVDKV